ncbi:MAG TPA: acyl-CoA dehydrogenase family protein [Kofleriaceae bacterium]|nr:acyl-CoA dehydrogenase family protein [Kofleriaceae bacterium]
MASFFKDNPDLQYYFERGIDWARLSELVEHGYRQPDGLGGAAEALVFYRDIAEMVGELVADEVAPQAAAIDRIGARLEGGEAVLPPAMDALFRKLGELDLHGMCLPRELGGLNCPLMLYFLSTELFARADVSMMSHFAFHGAMALSMLNLSMMEGTTEIDPDTGVVRATRFRDEIAEIASGKAWGSMDITEPDAGSDMAALRAVGRQEPDGSWTVTGQKIFITSGHGKYHFVIARTEPDAEGLAGLSMFLVPAYRDENGRRVRLATVDRIEEKLGHHGSVTAAITFDRTPAHLVGKRGDGFRFMLKLMNGARVAVGFESIGLCEAAYRLARDYAAGRPSMGKTIDRHEMVADYLDEMASDIQGLRALAVYGAFEEELAQRLAAAGKADEARPHQDRARHVTPLLKYLAAEKAVEMARRALQIHGGNGYMTEFGAEKLLRDALVMPIYEGTSQIQALMAMKDTLGGLLRDPQGFVRRVAHSRWRQVSGRDPLERRVAKLEGLSLRAQRHLITRTAADKLRSLRGQSLGTWPSVLRRNWNPKRDFAFAMLHAERLCRLMADVAIAEVLWEQAQRHPERRELLERYLDRAEPRGRFLVDEITSTGHRLLASLADRDRGDDGETRAASAAPARPRAAPRERVRAAG